MAKISRGIVKNKTTISELWTAVKLPSFSTRECLRKRLCENRDIVIERRHNRRSAPVTSAKYGLLRCARKDERPGLTQSRKRSFESRNIVIARRRGQRSNSVDSALYGLLRCARNDERLVPTQPRSTHLRETEEIVRKLISGSQVLL